MDTQGRSARDIGLGSSFRRNIAPEASNTKQKDTTRAEKQAYSILASIYSVVDERRNEIENMVELETEEEGLGTKHASYIVFLQQSKVLFNALKLDNTFLVSEMYGVSKRATLLLHT